MRIVVDGASTEAAASAEVIIRRDVLPGLCRAIGSSYRPPATLNLIAGEGHGSVPARLDAETGMVVDVQDPMVSVEGQHVAFLAAHELAHHHELRLRRQRRMTTGNLASSVFWTEYYANRIAFAAGCALPIRSMRRMPESLAVPAGASPVTAGSATSNGLLGVGYLFTLVLAEIQHLGDDWHVQDGDPWIVAMAMSPTIVGFMDDLYRRFPRWPPQATRDVPRRVGWILEALQRAPTEDPK